MPSPSRSPSAGLTQPSTSPSKVTSSLPLSPESMTSLPGLPPIATMMSGTSQRLILPSPLSSVRFATSGVARLPTYPPVSIGEVHFHLVTGENAFGGDD